MTSLWQILSKPFLPSRFEQQLLIALVVIGYVAFTIVWVTFAMRRTRPTRLHERRHVGRPVLIVWREGRTLKQSDEGFCQDVSTGGMGLDLPFPLKARTRLRLRLSELKLSGIGVVRRCKRVGSRYTVGVEFERLTSALMNG